MARVIPLRKDELPASFSLSARQPKPLHYRNSTSCRVLCSGGRRCVCRGDIKHEIHTCNDPTCGCRLDLRKSRGGVKP